MHISYHGMYYINAPDHLKKNFVNLDFVTVSDKLDNFNVYKRNFRDLVENAPMGSNQWVVMILISEKP